MGNIFKKRLVGRQLEKKGGYSYFNSFQGKLVDAVVLKNGKIKKYRGIFYWQTDDEYDYQSGTVKRFYCFHVYPDFHYSTKCSILYTDTVTDINASPFFDIKVYDTIPKCVKGYPCTKKKIEQLNVHLLDLNNDLTLNIQKFI